MSKLLIISNVGIEASIGDFGDTSANVRLLSELVVGHGFGGQPESTLQLRPASINFRTNVI